VRRFDMRLPACVLVVEDGSGELHTETQNISAEGLFFYLDREIAVGTQIEIVLTLPPQVTLTDSVRVRFRGRTVRVEQSWPLSRAGVAVAIETHEFLRSAVTLPA